MALTDLILKQLFLLKMEGLPIYVLYELASKLTLQEIKELGVVNKVLGERLLNNEEFWKIYYLGKYPMPKRLVTNWKSEILKKQTQIGIDGFSTKFESLRSYANGADFYLFVDNFGELWGFGENKQNQLGLNNQNMVRFPKKLPYSRLLAVAAGSVHTLILTEAGDAWGFGSNLAGQINPQKSVKIGLTFIYDKIISIAGGGAHSLFLTQDYTVLAIGDNYKSQINVKGLPPIKIMAGGEDHSLFLDFNGVVWGVGSNEDSKLGFNPSLEVIINPMRILNINKAIDISAGSNHSLVLDENWAIWIIGFGLPVRKILWNVPFVSISAGYARGWACTINGISFEITSEKISQLNRQNVLKVLAGETPVFIQRDPIHLALTNFFLFDPITKYGMDDEGYLYKV